MRQKLIEVLRLLRAYEGTPLVEELSQAEMLVRELLKDQWRYERIHVQIPARDNLFDTCFEA